MSKIQIVCKSDVKFVDPQAEKYIVLEPLMVQNHIFPMLDGKYVCIGAPFEEEKEYIRAIEYSVELSKKFVTGFGDNVANYYKISMSNRQWMIIMAMWIQKAIYDTYYRYCKFKRIDLHNTYIVGQSIVKIEKSGAKHIRNLFDSPEINAYLYSMIGNLMGFDVEYVKDAETENQVKKDIRKKERIQHWLKQLRKYPKKTLSMIFDLKIRRSHKFKNINKDTKVLLEDTKLTPEVEEAFSKKSEDIIGTVDMREFHIISKLALDRFERDIDLRRKLMEGVFDKDIEFERVLSEVLIHTMPISFLESFRFLYGYAAEIVNDWDLKKIYTAYSGSELFDFCAALASANGTELHQMQHSAAYGGVYTTPVGELLYADVFNTWGWIMPVPFKIEARIEPVAIARLPEGKLIPTQKPKNILLTCNYGLYSDLGSGWYYGEYLDREMEFIDALDEKLKRRLVVRIDPSDSINRELAMRCEEKYPYIRIENRFEVPYSKSVSDACLIVSDYYGSTHIEAMILNKPFVMFNGARIIVPNPAIKPYLEKFAQYGIYMDDGKDLAERLNRVDIDNYKLEDEAQELLKKYLYEFTRTGENTEDMWYSEFISGV